MALAEPESKELKRAKEMLSEDREYDSEAHAELDAALVEAIDKADEIGDEFLSRVLRLHLASFYLQTELGV